jgi:glycerol-3-phosphate O-acyltransferase
VSFFRKLISLTGGCVLRFGRPVDPYCNDVDDEGRSLGPQGQVIDPATYVRRSGTPVTDPAREAAYTRSLGERLAERYLEETVIMSTQLVAHLLFRRLVRATPGIDLFGRLRVRGEVAIPRGELIGQIAYARDRLRDAGVRQSPFLRREAPELVLARSLDAWSGYHRRVAAREIDGEVTVEDPTLLLYYQNRLIPFATRIAPPDDVEAAREIAAMGARA